jgi:hypothetical protein
MIQCLVMLDYRVETSLLAFERDIGIDFKGSWWGDG